MLIDNAQRLILPRRPPRAKVGIRGLEQLRRSALGVETATELLCVTIALLLQAQAHP